MAFLSTSAARSSSDYAVSQFHTFRPLRDKSFCREPQIHAESHPRLLTKQGYPVSDQNAQFAEKAGQFQEEHVENERRRMERGTSEVEVCWRRPFPPSHHILHECALNSTLHHKACSQSAPDTNLVTISFSLLEAWPPLLIGWMAVDRKYSRWFLKYWSSKGSTTLGSKTHPVIRKLSNKAQKYIQFWFG